MSFNIVGAHGYLPILIPCAAKLRNAHLVPVHLLDVPYRIVRQGSIRLSMASAMTPGQLVAYAPELKPVSGVVDIVA
jgi:hypothetical protein